MISPPETDRVYAYFSASGLFDPAAVTKAIGLEPADCWAAGDDFERRGHAFKRRLSFWRLDSGLSDGEALEAHVEALFRKLLPRRAGLLEAATLAKLRIQCVAYVYQSFDWELDTHHQRLAAALNIGFRFDIYPWGDLHEEMMELREEARSRSEESAG